MIFLRGFYRKLTFLRFKNLKVFVRTVYSIEKTGLRVSIAGWTVIILFGEVFKKKRSDIGWL